MMLRAMRHRKGNLFILIQFRKQKETFLFPENAKCKVKKLPHALKHIALALKSCFVYLPHPKKKCTIALSDSKIVSEYSHGLSNTND